MKYELPDIFLHFLEKDTQEIFSLQEANANSISRMQMALNMAVLLCKEYCILPVGTYFESESTKKMILSNLDYFQEGLLVFAMREGEVPEFLAKKQEQYKEFFNDVVYSRYFDESEIKSANELIRVQHSSIQRKTKVGEYCLLRWDKSLALFIDDYDGDISGMYSIDTVGAEKNAISVAKALKTKAQSIGGSAFIWKLMREEIVKLPEHDPKLQSVLHRLFQHYYYRAYLDEYEASILYDIFPFDRQEDFLLKKDYLSASNFRWFYEFLKCLQLDSVLLCPAAQLSRIKRLPEFESLLQTYLAICNSDEFLHNTASMRKEVSKQHLATGSSLKELATNIISVVTNKDAPSKKETSEMGKGTTSFNFYGETKIESSVIGSTIEGDMIVNFSQKDIADISNVIDEVIESATEQSVSEKAELLSKMEELRTEISSAKPRKNTIYAIVDWTHKITAISVASYNLYNILAPFVGLPPILTP